MYINKIVIKNFRLLKDVELLLEKDTTLILGRNNSGKTSLTEIFRRLLSETTPSFQLVDFSLQQHSKFWEAFKLKIENKEENEIRTMLPTIEIRITVNYDKSIKDLGPLSDFIIDLNPDCTEALIVISYQLKDGEMEAFWKDIRYNSTDNENKLKIDLLKELKVRIPDFYTHIIYAEDPNDSTNKKMIDWVKFRSLLRSNFIFAQRGLDDTTHKDINQLGNILEKLIEAAQADNENIDSQAKVKKLEEAVDKLQESIDGDFKDALKDLLPNFSIMGYPGLNDPKLLTETNLNIKNLMNKEHTKVLYSGINGINLPESYNGLGVRNLIFIMLKLYEFAKSIKAEQKIPGICLIFIEEPEVHLHPQMQQVFIRQLNEFFKKISDKGKSWPVQFVVTTHSSHIANESPFQTMRYFLAKQENKIENICFTEIKDLQSGLSKTKPKTKEFLHKYMTLTRCDLLFADKAVLIEGAAERLMLPAIITKIDEKQKDVKLRLSSQYISVVEVGGAYAHIFFDLLKFLELRTLIITDIDSVKDNKKCVFSEGTNTSNSSIKSWFNRNDITPKELIEKSNEERIKDFMRIAFEVPEKKGWPCGRTFEDAFILANQDKFDIKEGTNIQKEKYALEEIKDLSKTDFAIEYSIEKTEWEVPRYMAEGLIWLAEGERCQIYKEETPQEDHRVKK